MSEQRIEPHKVTKPIQLLAAWLVGLCILTGSFLGAAVAFKDSQWACGILISAAVLNVPLFLYAFFRLQTKYRPEMQEDSFYATYLDKNTNREIEVIKPSLRDPRLDEIQKEVHLMRNQIMHVALSPEVKSQGSKNALHRDWSNCRISINDLHPDFLAIRKALKKSGIPVAGIFGSLNNSHLPEKWILAVDVDCDPSLLQIALQELLKFSFDGVTLTKRDGIDEDHIYVGSYSFSDGYAPITDKLLELSRDGIDPVDFEYYVRKHDTK